jgi:hypothetical protein
MTDAETDEQFYRDTERIAFPKLDDRSSACWSRSVRGASSGVAS